MSHESDKTPRARRHDMNVERILETALELVAEGGLETMSMARLAAAVDFTPGALYRYFASKDALLSRLVERTLEDLRASLVAAVGALPPRTPPLVRVYVLAEGYCAFARLEPHRFGLLAMTLASPRIVLDASEHAEPVVRVMMAALQPLGEALASATEGGYLEAGDVSERTLCMFALLEGVLLMRKQARYAPKLLDVDRLATRGVRGLLIGWGATKRAVDDASTRSTALRASAQRMPGSPS